MIIGKQTESIIGLGLFVTWKLFYDDVFKLRVLQYSLLTGSMICNYLASFKLICLHCSIHYRFVVTKEVNSYLVQGSVLIFLFDNEYSLTQTQVANCIVLSDVLIIHYKVHVLYHYTFQH